MARLTPEQISKVSAWVAEGATLSQIQERLSTELEVSMTYMDVRFLVDDLNLALVEKEEPKLPEEAAADIAPADAATAPAETAQGAGVVTVEVDTIAQPHAMVSGHVTFSDGEKADWYIDHQGRPGMAARSPGYRPTPQDITDFQTKLDAALRQAGY
ncbi:MAG: hypothetical protein NTU71_06825 [Verrucomicrobia bacterium]|nr:hypothetical protein [Verrucomicrobiota bacterium]